MVVLDGSILTGFVKLIWSISEGKDETFFIDPIVVVVAAVDAVAAVSAVAAVVAPDDGGGPIVKFVVHIICEVADSDWSGPE